MYIVLVSLAVIIGILLILIVVIQKSKGSGLASGFAESNQLMGVRKTTDFLEKATWSLAGILVVLCIATAAFSGKESHENEATSIKNKIEETAAPAPMAPIEAPVAE